MSASISVSAVSSASTANNAAAQYESRVQQFIGLPRNSTPDSKVDALQRALNILGASPGLAVDGLYGSKTEAAVQKFLDRDMVSLERGAGIGSEAATRGKVKMLQRALNVLTNAQMDVDGKFGRQTEAALTLWQNGLTDNPSAVGTIDAAGWDALLVSLVAKLDRGDAYVPGSSSQAPSLANGLQSPSSAGALGTPIAWPPNLSRYNHTRVDTKLPDDDPRIHHYKPYGYGTRKTIEMIRAVAAEYHRRTGYVLRVGDISKRGGGSIPGHGSHKYGKNVDLDLAFNDGRTTAEPARESRNATWRSDAYDRNATRTLLKLIRQAYPGVQILFSDPVLVREGLCTAFRNHDNHMHLQRLY